MLPKQVLALVVSTLMMATASASPVGVAPPTHQYLTTDDVPPGLVILNSTTTSDNGGTLTWYGSQTMSADKDANDCKNSNSGLDPICRRDFAAVRDVCFDLINDLNQMPGKFDKKVTDVCRTNNGNGGNRCCISWEKGVSSSEYALDSLKPAAYAVWTNCDFLEGDTWMVSGLTRNTRVGKNNHCTTQCMSNRPNGCA
ncbi:hypothetical protein B0T20DRAFT_420518 [Sordaria brevicollis]|uniref:WD-like domain-containing protein n=1 Tax=Sordaria brevicollis TaxID=83679 RepID=A0AAE0U6B1_SORBR|nr:hypothetical protein B0T20DRAFT_420518 [Sordaria brevicollis]